MDGRSLHAPGTQRRPQAETPLRRALQTLYTRALPLPTLSGSHKDPRESLEWGRGGPTAHRESGPSVGGRGGPRALGSWRLTPHAQVPERVDTSPMYSRAQGSRPPRRSRRSSFCGAQAQLLQGSSRRDLVDARTSNACTSGAPRQRRQDPLCVSMVCRKQEWGRQHCLFQMALPPSSCRSGGAGQEPPSSA